VPLLLFLRLPPPHVFYNHPHLISSLVTSADEAVTSNGARTSKRVSCSLSRMTCILNIARDKGAVYWSCGHTTSTRGVRYGTVRTGKSVVATVRNDFRAFHGTRKLMVLVVAPCSLVELFRRFKVLTFTNVKTLSHHLPDYTAQHPIRQPSSLSPP
jgi:hypothetical protein